MSTNTAEAETPETTTSDGPLLDLTDAAVKKFIKQAKARGYVTMDELNKVLPSEEVTSEAIEDTLAMLSEMGVNVVEAEEDAEGGEVAVREEQALVETTKEPAYDRTDDPVRMYLREMGSVELLSREGEIAIAKRIEGDIFFEHGRARVRSGPFDVCQQRAKSARGQMALERGGVKMIYTQSEKDDFLHQFAQPWFAEALCGEAVLQMFIENAGI